MGGGKFTSTVICGLRGSGKTEYAKRIAVEHGRRCLVVDTVKDFGTGYNFYVWRPQFHFPEVLADLIKGITSGTEGVKQGEDIDLLIVDEANRYAAGGGAKLHPVIAEYNDQLRHAPYSCSAIWIVRRPVQLHPDIVGLADRVIVFRVTGVRDIRYLDDLCSGLGSQAQFLPDFYYLDYSAGKFEVKPPINIVK